MAFSRCVKDAHHRCFARLQHRHSADLGRRVLTNQLALRRFAPSFQLSFARGNPWTPTPLTRRQGDAPLSLTLSGPSAGARAHVPHSPLQPPCSQGRRSPLPLHPLAAVGSTRGARRLPWTPQGKDRSPPFSALFPAAFRGTGGERSAHPSGHPSLPGTPRTSSSRRQRTAAPPEMSEREQSPRYRS